MTCTGYYCKIYVMQRFLREGMPGGELTAVPIDMNVDLQGGVFSDTLVSDVGDYPAPRVEPLLYPGTRPEHAFTTGEGQVWPINVAETEGGIHFGVNTPEGVFDLNDALRYYRVAPMEDRHPIVGFGSNACPGQLCEKFSPAQNKWGDITEEGDHHIIPTLRGKLSDVAAAYSSRLGIHGYMFAELIEAQGAETEVFVNFLSPGQLARMIRSEGQYKICDLGEVTIDGMVKPITAYGFAGKNNVLLDAEGRPILLDSVNTKGVDMPSMSEVEVLNAVAAEFGSQLDAAYPNAPFYAGDASSLMAYSTYRAEFLRRPGRLTYKHHPEDGEQPDLLIGDTLQGILEAAGRTSADKLLDHLPIEKQDIEPHTFGQLYKQGW